MVFKIGLIRTPPYLERGFFRFRIQISWACKEEKENRGGRSNDGVNNDFGIHYSTVSSPATFSSFSSPSPSVFFPLNHPQYQARAAITITKTKPPKYQGQCFSKWPWGVPPLPPPEPPSSCCPGLFNAL
jgi:hypothetical protein